MMHGFRTLIFAIVVIPLGAQWQTQPAKKLNLSAPAPRAANGKPDLSGVWYLEHPPCADCDDYPAAPEFLNIAAKLPGGLPYQPWAAELVKQRTKGAGKDDPVARCLPAGAIRLLTFPPPRKIIQLPGLVVILSERDVTFQQIFTDGRPLPKDPAPNWNGYSVGKWEGDTLVVHTNGLRDETWIDRKGNPLTEAATLTEHFHRANYGRLEVSLTVDDPKAYTRPWTVALNQVLAPDTELLDYFCMDNEKDALHTTAK